MMLLLSAPLTLTRPLTLILALMPELSNVRLVTAAACPAAALSPALPPAAALADAV
jgi:hypothetical protein